MGAADRIRFDAFVLDVADRRLLRDGQPIELNARYLDALALLVREPGALVSKDRFMTEVWRGVPVTDEALTQCIRTLRRALGDDAAAPRFIQTVPKHGYRFVAEPAAGVDSAPLDRLRPASGALLPTVAAAGLGGGIAGAVGGLAYGFGAAAQVGGGGGGASLVVVLVALTILVGATGAAGVGAGIAAARRFAPHAPGWRVAGGAAGGLVVGALARLFGLDAFALLLGRAPDGITGGAEGAVLGAAIGAASWRAAGRLRYGTALAAALGAGAGLAIAMLGGRMMAGSLALLADSFPGSRLRLDWLGVPFGEVGLGPVARAVSGALEGGLFCAGVVAALLLAARVADAPGGPPGAQR